MALVIIGAAVVVDAAVMLVVSRFVAGRLAQSAGLETITAASLARLARAAGQKPGSSRTFSRLVAVKGVVKCDAPLTSPIGQQSCVYYRSTLLREYEGTYYETDAATGNQARRTRRGAEPIASTSQRVSFYLEDATGRLGVNPSDAEVAAVQAVDRLEPTGQGADGPIISFGGITVDTDKLETAAATGRDTVGYRLREDILPLGKHVYVVGEASDASGELTVQAPSDEGGKFAISFEPEKKLLHSATRTVRILIYTAFATGVAGLVALGIGVIGIVTS